jgi:flagellar motility protein MotE (MotC chaperone)
MPVFQRSFRGRKGTLLMVGFLLIVSASIRFAEGASEAIASEVSKETTHASDSIESNSVDVLFSRLQKMEAELVERELRIASREAKVKLAEQSVKKVLTEVQEAERGLRATIALADEAAENDLLQLTKVYESMKPKDAAALFQTMDPNFSAGFLARMPANSAASILAGMPPQLAYQVSLALSGRNLKPQIE